MEYPKDKEKKETNRQTHTHTHTEEEKEREGEGEGEKFNVTCNFFRRIKRRDLRKMGIRFEFRCRKTFRSRE